MARSDRDDTAIGYEPSRTRSRRRMPLTIRLAAAALLAAILALGASYALRKLNL